MKKFTLDSYKEKFYKKFPNSTIEILNFIDRKFVKVKNKYGICIISKCKFLNNGIVTILSSINKTEYLINRLKEIYGDKYDYSLVNWVNSKEKIHLICKIHGDCFIETNSLLQNGGGCKKCGIIKLSNVKAFSIFDFINQAKIIHNYKYNYEKTNYTRSFNKLKIICPIHGEFEQKANHHLQGHGCKKCANSKVSKINSLNTPGWGLNNWKKAALKSKSFDSFKIYIIKCWNEDEEFYKIGRTFKTIENRFKTRKSLPYNYKIIYSYINSADVIYELELKMKKENINDKYIPNIHFEGKQECFKLKNIWLEKLFS